MRDTPSDTPEAAHGTQGRPVRHWRRAAVDLAALCVAVAVAEALAALVGHGLSRAGALVAAAVALLATAAFHRARSRRPAQAGPSDAPRDAQKARGTARPPAAGAHAARAAQAQGAQARTARTPADESAPAEATALWRMRTTVRDEPGSLAALCAALAHRSVDILSLQTHPLGQGTVDEFLLRAPAALPAADLADAVTRAGGTDTWIERADAHDLVDAPTRVLSLATRTALDAAELPLALRQLLGRCTIRSLPSAPAGQGHQADETAPVEGALDGTVLRLRAPEGGVITVERPHLPFTPTEFARARALVELDARLGPRVPRGADVLTLTEGPAITVSRADASDLDAAKAMHDRCSKHTLGMRYHGPVRDADRYLNHLLSPRFGRTLAARTASGLIVGLGHLLWDGDETEVALLVEDDWQRRGIGGELLGRLVAMAAEAGCAHVYAVTQSSNTGMVAAMRRLGLPLDFQVEEGTLVITARLDATPVSPSLPYDHRA
ncbi:GNAT family N-acetyltransferase [Streptomyces sp. G45]|uniref:GNAT family N-acetyltransferase n=1 Tax=Streptomyces sp. G45 TaxID=3406627 RepID=UPI003C231A2E